MDMEFDKIKDLIPMINVNISATNEHVAEGEQRIRTTKERCRGIMGTLPFTFIPQQLIIGLVQFVTMWLNAFPSNTGISRKLGPREIICRHKLDVEKHCKTPFRAYCEVNDEPDPSNSMVSCIQSAYGANWKFTRFI